MLSRRNLIFGTGGFVLGGAITAVAGIKFRNELKEILGFTRPTTLRLVQLSDEDDGWLLSEEERTEYEQFRQPASIED